MQQVLTLPARPMDTNSQSFILARIIMLQAKSLEEIILKAVRAHFSLKIGVAHIEGEKKIILEFQKSTGRSPESPCAFAYIPPKMIHKPTGYQPLNEEIHRFADQEGYVVDETWWENRNKRLRIRFDKWNSDLLLAPAASLRELILSYLLSSMGIVTIKPTIIDLSPGPKSALLLELVYLESLHDEGPTLIEHLHMRLDHLENLIKKRKARQSTLQKY